MELETGMSSSGIVLTVITAAVAYATPDIGSESP